MSAPEEIAAARPGALAEVAWVFLKLGLIGFGGPAAHIALMREEIVRRRRWVSDARFLDLLGVTNLIPGPNSTEMAIHLGYQRAGWPGLLVGGTLFIVPAMLSVLACAWVYVRYRASPELVWLLYGIKPVVIVVILQAVWALGRAALRTTVLAAVGVAALALYLVGVNELMILGGAAVVVLAARRLSGGGRPGMAAWLVVTIMGASALADAAELATPFSRWIMFAAFLKIGSVIYGSGYVLLAFLRNEFVVRLGWLDDAELLDAVAIGQVTPGPVFTTATFIGYLLGGWTAALIATAGIFLPAFVFVAATYPLISRVRRSASLGAALDGVNAAALGLMAGVTWTLGRAAIVDVLTGGIAIVAAVLVLRFRVNTAWLIVGAGAVSVLYRVFLS